MCFDITNSPLFRMKAACVVIIIALVLAIVLLGIMVKVASDLSVDERTREISYYGDILQSGKLKSSMRAGVGNSSLDLDYIAERFPYLVAVLRSTNSRPKPVFSCFGALVSRDVVISSAHCYTPDITSKYRMLLLNDLANNLSWTHNILSWKTHSRYSTFEPDAAYDIALARVNTTLMTSNHLRLASIDHSSAKHLELSLWKTLNSNDDYQTTYLTKDFFSFAVKAANIKYCQFLRKKSENEIGADDGVICVDLGQHSDCFLNEFGPIFIGDKLVGVLSKKPEICGIKHALFTNVSYHSYWIRTEIKSS